MAIDSIARGLAAGANSLLQASQQSAAHRLMQRLRQGRDAAILINSDSTGVDSNLTSGPYKYRKLSVWLGQLFPAATVVYYNSPSGNWSSATRTVLQAGTGSQVLYVYNAAVAGVQANFWYGSTLSAMFGKSAFQVEIDLIIFNHGHNDDIALSPQSFSAGYQAAVAQLSAIWPEAGIIVTKQNPQDPGPSGIPAPSRGEWAPNTGYALNDTVASGLRVFKCTTAGTSGADGSSAPKASSGSISDGTVVWQAVASGQNGYRQAMQQKVEGWQIAAELNGWSVADEYAAWMAAGNPPSWKMDGLHPSQVGDDFNLAVLTRLFVNTLAGPTKDQPILMRGTNLLSNGRFQTQTGGATAVPDGWTGTNTTISQYTTSVENGGSFALKVANTATGKAYIEQTIPDSALAAVRGRWMTVAARVLIPATGDVYCGAIGYTTADGTYSTWGLTSSGFYTGGYLWQAISFYVPTTGAVTVRLFGVGTAGITSGKYAVFDRVSAVPGLVMRDAA